MPDPRDPAAVRLAQLARRQHGVFALRQAEELGLHRTTISRRARRGRYVRLLTGVYGETGVPDSRERRWSAALLAVGDGYVLSHVTAAELHGLPLPAGSRAIHLLSVAGRSRRVPSAVLHRCPSLAAEDLTTVRRLRVTAVARTLVDLAGELDGADLRRVVAAAARDARDLDAFLGRLHRCLERHPGTSGRARLLRLAGDLTPLDVAARNAFEGAFARLTAAAGIAPTGMNLPVTDAEGRRRVLDAAYVPERLPVELDSRAYHGTLLDWNDDLRREAAVKLAGWRDPVRFSAADVRDRPDWVVEVLRLALADARAVDGGVGARAWTGS